MSVKKNINPAKNIITTTMACLLFCVTIGMYVAPIWITVPPEMQEKWYLPLIPSALGLVFLFMPDEAAKKALGVTDVLKNKI